MTSNRHPRTPSRAALLPIALLALLAALTACDDGSTENNDADVPQCAEGQVYNPTLARCIQQAGDMSDGFFEDVPDVEEDTTTADTADQDTTAGDTADQDTGTDTAEPDIDPACDQDGDGFLAESCGGNDCNDNSLLVSPTRGELCDDEDNNCDGTNNEGLDCTFYAHTRDTLYRLDPFDPDAAPVEITSVPMLHDIDTHPSGTLYGVTRERLYQFDPGNVVWVLVGSFPETIEDANGLAIDTQGNAFVTSANQLYSIDLVNPMNSQLLGDMGNDAMGEPLYSSGDCVLNKSDTLYMTAKRTGRPDTLVLVDQMFATGQEIGEIGVANVYGLTAAWGMLFGVSSQGHLVEIDRTTGEGTLRRQFQGMSFWGAASTPDR